MLQVIGWILGIATLAGLIIGVYFLIESFVWAIGFDLLTKADVEPKTATQNLQDSFAILSVDIDPKGF